MQKENNTNIINNEVVVNFVNASQEEKKKVIEILRKNYDKFLKIIEDEGDYVTVESYWKDFIPISKRIITAKEFIEEYSSFLKK